VPVEALRHKTPAQVRSDVAGFSQRYVRDWENWLGTGAAARPALFGRILRKWQAARPGAVRRLRNEQRHDAPFLDDLLADADGPLRELAGITIVTIGGRTTAQGQALEKLWRIFSRLRTGGPATCVGITKAILLLTDGRIGPAFDSRVRKSLRVRRPETCAEWLEDLESIAEDIAAFERAHRPLKTAVPVSFAHLEYGRLYDMALGRVDVGPPPKADKPEG
jgi:hypothetical protein